MGVRDLSGENLPTLKLASLQQIQSKCTTNSKITGVP